MKWRRRRSGWRNGGGVNQLSINGVASKAAYRRQK